MCDSGHAASTVTSFTYGDHPAQVCDAYLPGGDLEPRGVVVLVHGGYWRARYDRSLQHPVAGDLVARGWAVWNVDYRGVGSGGNDGGGWPQTYLDVAAAGDLLVQVAVRLGLQGLVERHRVAVVGHSVGGALALWLAGRHRLPAGSPGADPLLRPGFVVAQGAVCDLLTAAAQPERYGAGAVLDLFGATPQSAPQAYAAADPGGLVPLGAATLLVTADDDDAVPFEQSVRYADRARAAGDDVRLEVVAGEGHFGHLDPTSRSWRIARDWLEAGLSRSPASPSCTTPG